MAYMYAKEVNDVVDKSDNKDIVGALIERFYQNIVTKDNQKLLDIAFNEKIIQQDIDEFMKDWDIEEHTSNHGLMLAYMMKARPDLTFPDTIRPRLVGMLNFFRFQNLQLIAHFTKICRELNKNNIKPLILKGGAMRHLRPDLPRLMGDIDILVHPKDYEKSCQIAKELGYWFEDNPRAHSVDLHLSEDNEAGVLDIHRWIYLNSKYDIGYMDEFFKRSKVEKVFGADVYVPSTEDMVFIALLNLSKNLYKNTSMTGVLFTLFDCKYLLSKATNFNWEHIVKTTIETNTQVQMYFAMRFVNRIIPGLLPEEIFEHKELIKKIDKYFNKVMFERFYVDDLRQTCKKIRIKNAIRSFSVLKDYLRYKPKYLGLKIIRKSSWGIKYFLILAHKLKGTNNAV